MAVAVQTRISIQFAVPMVLRIIRLATPVVTKRYRSTMSKRVSSILLELSPYVTRVLIFTFLLSDLRRVRVHSRVASEHDERAYRRRRSLPCDKHNVRQCLHASVALRCSRILQHAHDLSLHNARAVLDPQSRSGRSEIVRSGDSMDQGQNIGNYTSSDGIRCFDRRHVHSLARDLRGTRSLSGLQ